MSGSPHYVIMQKKSNIWYEIFSCDSLVQKCYGQAGDKSFVSVNALRLVDHKVFVVAVGQLEEFLIELRGQPWRKSFF